MPAGYSGTPLAKRLTLRDGHRCLFDSMPDSVRDEIDEYGLGLTFVSRPELGFDAAHLFVTDERDLETKLMQLRPQIAKDGQIWVSWPKKGSGQETALDQAAVQRVGVASGFVDIKKCAIDHTWSGLKFVIPKSDR